MMKWSFRVQEVGENAKSVTGLTSQDKSWESASQPMEAGEPSLVHSSL